jgi:choline monooxygenase
METLDHILAAYNDRAPLAEAATIPAPFYTDARIADLERRTVFSRSWQMVGRLDQVAKPGEYITATVAEEPIVVVRGDDGVLRAFYNVCRHHAAAVMTEPQGCAKHLRCPYHGWTYGLDGTLKGAPEFNDVRNFDRSQNGLVQVRVEGWEKFVFVSLDPAAPSLPDFLGGMVARFQPLGLAKLRFFDRRVFHLNCNWKVFVDNYLDGGYHVPHLHKGLSSVLEYTDYKIECEDRYCLQSSPVVGGGEKATSAVRKGYAYYFWLYPNVMFNWYEGYLDTNFTIPLGIDRCMVIFDFYFADVSKKAAKYNKKSIEVSARVQDEDHGICESVQRGLNSRAYGTGRLSVRREAGEHLFHRLLTQDLREGLERDRTAAD